MTLLCSSVTLTVYVCRMVVFQVIDVRNSNTSSVEYCVHYAGWNTRYDEWIKYDAIISVIDTPTTDATTPAAGRQKQTSVSASVILLHCPLVLFLKFMMFVL